MRFRFLSPLNDGIIADFAVEAPSLRAAYKLFTASKPATGSYAVWCGLRLAGYLLPGPRLVEVEPEPSHANPFACGD
jgi:hypothetical protein